VSQRKDMMAGAAPFAPKRGRPTADQSAAIERAIRDAARRAFLSDGYEHTAMEAVAASAGVPKSTLYKRFPDKRALLRAVLSEQLSVWCETERTPAAADLEMGLKHLAADILRHAATPEVQAFWALVSTAWNGPDEARQRQDAIGYTKMLAGLEREIRHLAEHRGITARDARQVATALMAMLAGWIEHVAPALSRPEEEAQRFAHASVDMLIRGIAAW
jgi:AcrR family transcriptional regulator